MYIPNRKIIFMNHAYSVLIPINLFVYFMLMLCVCKRKSLANDPGREKVQSNCTGKNKYAEEKNIKKDILNA